MALNPSQYLASIDADTGAAFGALRKAVMKSGPLDEKTCELIVTASFAASGSQMSFNTHARRLLALGATVAEIRQAVLVTFAATTVFSDVVTALRWIDELTE
jgi:alkylhydroperoxidase/carboxymuconolactone decarboxylase family protein YurZ